MPCETLYKSAIEYWATEAKAMSKYNPKYVYFLFDINRDGIKELIVDNKGMGTAYSHADVYTVVNSGRTSTITHCGQSMGLAGFRSFPCDYNGRLRAVHRMADEKDQYEIELRNGMVVDNLIGVYGINETVKNSGTAITYYNIYSIYMGDYNTSIVYVRRSSRASPAMSVRMRSFDILCVYAMGGPLCVCLDQSSTRVICASKFRYT